MRFVGADLRSAATLVALADDGRIVAVLRARSLPEVAAAVGQLVAGEPFLLGVNVPVVVPAEPLRSRPVENSIRRRFGVRLPPGGRAALTADGAGVAGEVLMAGLA
ncbi:MAG TPA: hypothetical protein VJS92_08490, partial [Candidatus Polarisedimenticolaceae bacterium]|nr:hypothetical protein [Candidatus Polarisedimenticolaceae bacterium]